MIAVNETKSGILAENVELATALLDRMKGLLGRNGLAKGCALFIHPCNSIHTFFMRFPIDVVFLNGRGEVVRTYKNVRPFRMTRWIPRAKSVLELPAGTLDDRPVNLGDQVLIQPKGDAR